MSLVRITVHFVVQSQPGVEREVGSRQRWPAVDRWQGDSLERRREAVVSPSVRSSPTLFGRCRSKYAEIDWRSGSGYFAATSNRCNRWCLYDTFFWNNWQRRRSSSGPMEKRIKCSSKERILPRIVPSVISPLTASISARESPLEQAIILFCNEPKTICSMAARRRCWSTGSRR